MRLYLRYAWERVCSRLGILIFRLFLWTHDLKVAGEKKEEDKNDGRKHDEAARPFDVRHSYHDGEPLTLPKYGLFLDVQIKYVAERVMQERRRKHKRQRRERLGHAVWSLRYISSSPVRDYKH